MNILPKKRWHVRTKDNIARVRRDEAKAAEEERERQRRVKLADQEARMSLLRGMANDRMTESQRQELKSLEDKPQASTSVAEQGHVNFFSDLEVDSGLQGNKEREAELKKEQEEYEKKVGYLTYLGQDTHELNGSRPWWEKLPQNRSKSDDETDDLKAKESQLRNEKLKESLDPIKNVRQYLITEGVSKIVRAEKSVKSRRDSDKKSKKKKKDKKGKKSKKKSKRRRKSSSESESEEDKDQKFAKQQKLAKLRQERLKREEKERARANNVLYGTPLSAKKEEDKKSTTDPKEHKKYNSQFNPHLAKQNKLNANDKYWLSWSYFRYV